MAELDRDDEEVYAANVTTEDAEFDGIMGALEDILMSDAFAQLQTAFCQSNCAAFDDADENKHEYYAIFQQYSALVASHIEGRLAQTIDNFSMNDFTQTVLIRKDEGDVFDLLRGVSDFLEFKQMMLAHKRGETLALEIINTDSSLHK